MNDNIETDSNKTILKEFKEEVLEEYQRVAGTDSTIDCDSPDFEILLEIDKLFMNFCQVSLYEKPLPITEFAKDEGDLILSEIGKLENIVLASAIVETIKNYNTSVPIAIAEWAQNIKFDPAIKDRFKAAKQSLNSYLKNHYKDENQNDKWEDYINPDVLGSYIELEEQLLGKRKTAIRIAAFVDWLWQNKKSIFTNKIVQTRGKKPNKDLAIFADRRFHKNIGNQLLKGKEDGPNGRAEIKKSMDQAYRNFIISSKSV
ncbi:hypothetical protein [Niabella aquatica]